ncbi:hypothetical protein BS78_K052800 [Paspalum vaginatum]|uniref:KIB1-4 beta-propeller domain-containing protein n=1 Tax=Paspalum vaginatum TaxID=158149 RepID=A0A9W7XCU0_9POAL|nr:hypothetical protein BS78_K052800 [Paspalum vaginatum]
MDCKCLLTYQDVTHPRCHIMLFDLLEPNKWYLKVAAGEGDHRWSRYTYDLGNYEVPGEPVVTKRIIYSVAAVQGELFFISSHEDMCAITFSTSASEPEFQYFDACLVAFPDEMCSGRTWLVENDGDLFLVSIFFVDFNRNNIGAIHVYKMDFSTETWCRVHDIGDAVFLLKDANMAAACRLPSQPPRAQREPDLLHEELDGRRCRFMHFRHRIGDSGDKSSPPTRGIAANLSGLYHLHKLAALS